MSLRAASGCCLKFSNRGLDMLTEIQRKILDIIIKYKKENKMSPTVREIGEITKIKSTSTVQGHLNSLEKKGFIERKSSIPRSIIVLKSM